MNSPEASPQTTIIGAGPAGVSAALWARTYDLEFRWIDREGEVGGMLDRVENPIENYPGASYADGSELAASLRRQIRSVNLAGPEAADVARIVRRNEGLELHLADGDSFTSQTVILATGTEYRQLGVPGESEGLGSYVSQSTSRDAERVAGRTVAVVGGGDAGFEGALQLADHGCRVHMLLRSEPTRARPQFVEPARACRRITVHPIPSVVERIEPIPERSSCRLHVNTRGERRRMEVACMFVRIGVDPVTPDIDPDPERDGEGFVRTDREQRTSTDALFAAGEVTDVSLPSVAVAVGAGATALHSAAVFVGAA